MAVPSLSWVSFSLLILQTLTYITAHPALNISHFLYPKTSEELRLRPFPFLEDILRGISVRQGWNESEEIRVSKLDSRNARFGSSRRYDFRLRMGKTQLIFELSDDVSLWKKMMMKRGAGFESAVREVGSVPVLNAFRIKGPLELIMRGENEFLLQLPGNTSHAGLTRMLVGDDVTLEVRNAQDVAAFYMLELGLNKSYGEKKGGKFWPFQHSTSESFLPVHISGSATITAYRGQSHNSYIQTRFLSKDMIELLPQKCYLGRTYERRQYQIETLSSRIAAIGKLLGSILGSKIHQNGNFGFLRANVKASTLVRFKMELERKFGKEDTLHGMLAEWRTRPTVERVWFEVVAGFEGDRFKPLTIREIRPFIEVDSSAWSNIMSNISFTKFPSLLVPPEDLTLDVKWVLHILSLRNKYQAFCSHS